MEVGNLSANRFHAITINRAGLAGDGQAVASKGEMRVELSDRWPIGREGQLALRGVQVQLESAGLFDEGKVGERTGNLQMPCIGLARNDGLFQPFAQTVWPEYRDVFLEWPDVFRSEIGIQINLR